MEPEITIKILSEDDMESIEFDIKSGGITIFGLMCDSDSDTIPREKIAELVSNMEQNAVYELTLSNDHQSIICSQNGMTTFHISNEVNDMNVSIPNNLCIEQFKKMLQ